MGLMSDQNPTERHPVITPHIAISFEGINLTKSDVKTYARTENQPWFIVEGNSRFLFGARYKF